MFNKIFPSLELNITDLLEDSKYNMVLYSKERVTESDLEWKQVLQVLLVGFLIK